MDKSLEQTLEALLKECGKDSPPGKVIIFDGDQGRGCCHRIGQPPLQNLTTNSKTGFSPRACVREGYFLTFPA